MDLRWTDAAIADRRAIFTYIEAENPHAAAELDELFQHKAELLLEYPEIGRPGRVRGTRELVAHHHYVITYEIYMNTIHILRILHTSQQWPPT